MKLTRCTLVAVALSAVSSVAHADVAAADAPTPRVAPYSLPWQLRPAGAATVLRADDVYATYENAAGDGGSTFVSALLGSYKLTPELAPFVRVAYVRNSPPVGDAGAALANPAVGATWAPKLGGDLRFACSLAVTVPIGQGGGDDPDKAQAAAVKSAMAARSAMDNSLFAVNDVAIIPGVDLAWVSSGLTVQVEATVFQLARVRGASVQADSSKTNFTTGLHVGYFLLPALSLGGELRHQRWLSTPAAVSADPTGTLRDTTTFAVGPRLHVKLSDAVWFRPGLAYARALDRPMTDSKYQIVQLDLPFAF